MILFVQVLASSVCGQGKESYIPPVKQQMDLDKPLPTSNFKIIAILGYWYYTHTHPFNGPLSRTTRVSRYQKGKTSLDFTEARDSEWQWHQLGHIQVCISLQTDNHASTPPLSFFTGRMPFLPPNRQHQSTEAHGYWYYRYRNPGIGRCSGQILSTVKFA